MRLRRSYAHLIVVCMSTLHFFEVLFIFLRLRRIFIVYTVSTCLCVQYVPVYMCCTVLYYIVYCVPVYTVLYYTILYTVYQCILYEHLFKQSNDCD